MEGFNESLFEEEVVQDCASGIVEMELSGPMTFKQLKLS
jgi:hypothetical protein